MIETNIKDPFTNKTAKVVNSGSLSVLPPHYNQIFSILLDEPDTVYNVVPAVAGHYFVGNTLVLKANKQVGTNDATVSIYAAGSEDAVLTSDEFLTLEMATRSQLVVPNMNVITQEKGVWVNAVTDDDDVYLTLFGYYTEG